MTGQRPPNQTIIRIPDHLRVHPRSPERQRREEETGTRRKRRRGDDRVLIARVVSGREESKARKITEFGLSDRILAITQRNREQKQNPYYKPILTDQQDEAFRNWVDTACGTGDTDRWVRVDSRTSTNVSTVGSICRRCLVITLDNQMGRQLCMKCAQRK